MTMLHHKQHASMPGGILIITRGKTTGQAEELVIGRDRQKGADNSALTGGITGDGPRGLANYPS